MDPDYAAELVALIEQSGVELLRIPPDVAAHRPGSGKWSIKEIVGHLIDSAVNNQQRFVTAQLTSDLVFAGYDQDAWVTTQRYQDAPWSDLVVLWRDLNLHIARTMTSIPIEVRRRQRREHNLDRIAFRPIPADQPTTLDYLMRDYVEHMKHHLGQIAVLDRRPSLGARGRDSGKAVESR